MNKSLKCFISVVLTLTLFSVSLIGLFPDACAAKTYTDTSGYVELDELYKDYFRIGVAVQAIDHWNDPTAEIGNPDKEALIDRCFNSMTFGNELKPAYNFDSKSPTLFTVDPAAEELLEWAKEHNMPVRGHTLVWHSQVNPAIFAKDFNALSNGRTTRDEKAKLDEDCLVSRDELIKRLKTYIYGAIEYTYANGYGDVIYAWDVVNEAVDENASEGLRDSYWKQIIGPEYLYYCFLFAREACVIYSRQYADLYGIDPSDPDADYSAIMPELFYNDYNEWFSARSTITVRFISEDIYNPARSMVESDVIDIDGDGTILGDGLIDGIGMQGHIDSTQNIDEYTRALEKYDECIGNVHITELDVGISGTGEKAYNKQAEFYYDFFSALMDEVDEGVGLTCVTFWGLTDDASWRRGADPLLFKSDLSAKSAFDAVAAAGSRADFEVKQVSASGTTADLMIDFEPVDDKLAVPVRLGVTSRGSGHQSKLMLLNTENNTKGASPGYSVKVSRSESDATVKIDISGFTGEYISQELYIKTEDKSVIVGIEGDGGSFALEKYDSNGGWICASGCYHIPEEWSGAAIYVETDGIADIYLDDIAINKLKEDDPKRSECKEADDTTGVTSVTSDDDQGGTGIAADGGSDEQGQTEGADNNTPEGADSSEPGFFTRIIDKITAFFRNLFG